MKQSAKINGAYIFTLLLITTAVYIFYIYLAAQNHFSQLEPMIYGSASRPYVYRVFAPLIIRFLLYVIDISPFSAAIWVMYLSLMGYSLCMLALTRIFLPIKFFKGCALLAPVGLIPFLFEQRHLYDFPTLFLFTLALYYLAKNDLPKYILVFILVTLSKETSLFLVVFFAMQFRKMERRSFLAVVLIQIAIYVFIRGLLMDIYKNNPGRILEFHLYEHLNAYSQHPVYALILFSTIILIMSLGAFISMDKSNFVRNSLSAIGGPALLLYFFFGVPFEVRVFLETYPSIYLTVCLAIVFFIDRSPHVKQLTYAG